MVADRIAALVRLRALPRSERRVAILMPDYPGAPGSHRLRGRPRCAGKRDRGARRPRGRRLRRQRRTADPRGCSMRSIAGSRDDASLAARRLRKRLLGARTERRVAPSARSWGEPADDPDVRDGAFRFRRKHSATSWSRCRPIAAERSDRRADYHDPPLPPRHALVAFGLWLQHVARVDALVHMGAHGTLEWLPGKAVALTAECFPEIVTGRAAGDLSVHRQQSGRGGAGQAPHRRRDHRPSAAAARRRRAVRRRPRARAAGRRISPRPTASTARRRERLASSSSRPRSAPAWRAKPASPTRVRARRSAAPHRCLAVRSERPRHQGRPAHLRPRSRRGATIRRGGPAPQPNAPRCSPRSTAGASRPGRPARRRAAGATCCRPAAICSPPIRARCRRRPPWNSAGSPPTKSSAPICRPTAKCRAPS